MQAVMLPLTAAKTKIQVLCPSLMMLMCSCVNPTCMYVNARTFAWTSIYYLDVIKSRMQMETAQRTPGKTWMDYGKQVWLLSPQYCTPGYIRRNAHTRTDTHARTCVHTNPHTQAHKAHKFDECSGVASSRETLLSPQVYNEAGVRGFTKGGSQIFTLLHLCRLDVHRRNEWPAANGHANCAVFFLICFKVVLISFVIFICQGKKGFYACIRSTQVPFLNCFSQSTMEVFNYNIFFVLITGLQPTLVRAFLMDAIAFYGFSLALHALDDV